MCMRFTVCQMSKLGSCCVRRELSSVLRDNLEGGMRGVGGVVQGEGIQHIHRNDLLHCIAETSTAL